MLPGFPAWVAFSVEWSNWGESVPIKNALAKKYGRANTFEAVGFAFLEGAVLYHAGIVVSIAAGQRRRVAAIAPFAGHRRGNLTCAASCAPVAAALSATSRKACCNSGNGIIHRSPGFRGRARCHSAYT